MNLHLNGDEFRLKFRGKCPQMGGDSFQKKGRIADGCIKRMIKLPKPFDSHCSENSTIASPGLVKRWSMTSETLVHD